MSFPPKLSDYMDAGTSRYPTVTVNKARFDIFSQYKYEYGFITRNIKRLPGGTENSNGGEEEDEEGELTS